MSETSQYTGDFWKRGETLGEDHDRRVRRTSKSEFADVLKRAASKPGERSNQLDQPPKIDMNTATIDQDKVLPLAGMGNFLPKKICTTALAFVTFVACATSASAQSVSNEADSKSASAQSAKAHTAEAKKNKKPAPKPDPDGSAAAVPLGSAATAAANAGALSASELAKEISNPVTSIWQLQFQFNNLKLESGDFNPASGKWVNNLYFQPVLPVSLTKDLNLITRPVLTLYDSVPHPTATGGTTRTTSFGDTILAQVLSPAHTEPWIFAAGPTWIFPTAGSDFTGQGKWQVGPAVGGGYITDKFMIAALAQQWWSFAGNEDRRDTSQVAVLPLVYAFFGEGWSVGYSGQILADWEAQGSDRWTVPLGLSVGKVVKFGQLPVQIQIAGQYFVQRPNGGPEWNVQLQITPVIPRLIKGTLFK
jgi:hypothetical protein